MSAPPSGVVLRRDEPLARHLPCRVGGPCEAWIVVHRRDALPDALAMCRDEGWKVQLLGAGTRTVVRDGGLSGAVLRLGTGFCGLAQVGDAWEAGAALPLAALAGPLSAPALSRQPGTLGASLALDSGWEPWLESVRFVHRGRESSGDLAELRSRGPGAVVVSVRLRAAAAVAPGAADPGSWYEPLERGSVADAIRESDLGDTRLRHVLVPDEAPDLLVNLGGAPARDLALVQRSILDRVQRVRGVDLVDRMRWLGRA